MQSLSSLFSHSPSSRSSSSDELKRIASHQFAPENNNSNYGRFLLQDAFIKDDAEQLVSTNNQQQQHCNDDTEDEFEFAAFASVVSPVPADQIFYKGQIRPLNSHLKVDNNSLVSCMIPRAARVPLRKLLVKERELDTSVSSCSSSVTEELEGVEAGTYCVWGSKTAADDSPELRNKSNNFSKWKLRDFLKTNNCSGKNTTFAFIKYS